MQGCPHPERSRRIRPQGPVPMTHHTLAMPLDEGQIRALRIGHTAPNVRKVDVSPANPVGYAPVCVGTTTSERMERFTRALMAQYGVRIIIGKGGLGEASKTAFAEFGGVYLAVIGGAAAPPMTA